MGPVSYRTPTTALAPIFLACESISSKDSCLADSHRLEKIPALPPKRVLKPPMTLKGRERVRTVIPRTTPRDFTVRYPGSSNVVVVCMRLSYSNEPTCGRNRARGCAQARDSLAQRPTVRSRRSPAAARPDRLHRWDDRPPVQLRRS